MSHLPVQRCIFDIPVLIPLSRPTLTGVMSMSTAVHTTAPVSPSSSSALTPPRKAKVGPSTSPLARSAVVAGAGGAAASLPRGPPANAGGDDKKAALSRADRRASQEAQRAAQAGGTKVAPSESTKPAPKPSVDSSAGKPKPSAAPAPASASASRYGDPPLCHMIIHLNPDA